MNLDVRQSALRIRQRDEESQAALKRHFDDLNVAVPNVAERAVQPQEGEHNGTGFGKERPANRRGDVRPRRRVGTVSPARDNEPNVGCQGAWRESRGQTPAALFADRGELPKSIIPTG